MIATSVKISKNKSAIFRDESFYKLMSDFAARFDWRATYLEKP